MIAGQHSRASETWRLAIGVLVDVVAELVPGGALRAGTNTANFLLVTGKGHGASPKALQRILPLPSRPTSAFPAHSCR